MRHIPKNNAHHMSVSLSDFYFSSIIALLGGLRDTVEAVYFLNAFNVKTRKLDPGIKQSGKQ